MQEEIARGSSLLSHITFDHGLFSYLKNVKEFSFWTFEDFHICMFKKLPENRLTTDSLTLLKFSKRIRPTRLVEKDHMYCVITY